MSIVSIGSAGYYFVDGERIAVVRTLNEVPKGKSSVRANAAKSIFKFHPARDKNDSTHRDRVIEIGRIIAAIRTEQDTKLKTDGVVKCRKDGEDYVVEIEGGKPPVDDYRTVIRNLQYWDDPAAEDAAKAEDKKKAREEEALNQLKISFDEDTAFKEEKDEKPVINPDRTQVKINVKRAEADDIKKIKAKKVNKNA